MNNVNKHIISLPAIEATLADLPDYVGPEKPRLRFLGTGTSAGVPILGCHCPVCESRDPRDHRYRTCALLETRHSRILIDCGPDIREQLMPLPFYPLDGILLTHIHYDHVAGLDDIRGFCVFGDQHIYADRMTCEGVRHNMPYCFTDKLYPGVPLLKLHEVEPHVPFMVGDQKVIPFEVMHGKVPIMAYRIGNLAYITDMKTISETEMDCLKGVDTLVVNALRWEKEHHSHMLVDDAVEFARRVGARQTYLVHVTHHIGFQDEAEARLPEGIHLAYDGLEIEIGPHQTSPVGEASDPNAFYVS